MFQQLQKVSESETGAFLYATSSLHGFQKSNNGVNFRKAEVTMLQVLDYSLSDRELNCLSMPFIMAKSCRNDTVVSSRGLQTLPGPCKYACCQQMHFESDHAEQGSCATRTHSCEINCLLPNGHQK
jgi:hypothetical protein